jgi:hypothetical protein
MRVITKLLILVTAFAVLHIPATSAASEQVGIYALVERVVLEPDDKNPQRIQLWGAFATSRSTANPKKGYMYFSLPASQQATALKEWADFKSTAGKGRVVSFGESRFGLLSPGDADAYHASLGRVRNASEKPQSPDVYKLNFGVYTINNGTIMQSLMNALKG